MVSINKVALAGGFIKWINGINKSLVKKFQKYPMFQYKTILVYALNNKTLKACRLV